MKKVGSFLIAGLLVSTISFTAYANGRERETITDLGVKADTVVIDSTEYSNDEELQKAITNALNNPDVVHCIIENDDLREQQGGERSGTDDMSYQICSPYDNIIYRVGNLKKVADTYGEDETSLGIMSGDPGITIGLQYAKSKTYQINAGTTYGASEKLVFDAGWSGATTSTVTYVGSWKVPSVNKANGKKVKKGVLHMRPLYENKSYTVYYRMFGTSNWLEKGKSKTSRVKGTDVYKTYIYK